MSVILSIFLQPLLYITYPSTYILTKRSHFKPSLPRYLSPKETTSKVLVQKKNRSRYDPSFPPPATRNGKRGKKKKKKKEKRRLTRQPSLDKLDERSETSCHYCRWNAVSRGYLRNRPLKHAEAAFRSFLPSP